MKRKVTLYVEGDYGHKNFSTTIIDFEIPGYGIHGYGDTAREAIEDTLVSVEEMRELAAEDGKEIPEMEFMLKFDIGAFFSYHEYLNISAVAKRMGINPSLMRRYASGKTHPTAARYDEIMRGIEDIANELKLAKVG